MAKRVELSFPTDPIAQSELPGDEYAYGYGADMDVQDTAAPNSSSNSTLEQNVAKLEHLRVGNHTVAEMVKGLEKVLGHGLYPSKIIERGMYSNGYVCIEKKY